MARHDPGPEPDPAPTPPDGVDPAPEPADVTDTGDAGTAGAAAGAPRVLMRAFVLWLLVVVLGIAELAVTYSHSDFTLTGSGSDPEADHAALFTQVAILSVVVAVVWWVVEVLAAFALRRGRGWARVVLSVFGAVTVVLNVVQLVGAVPAAASGYVQDLLEVVLLVLQAAAVIAALVLTYQPASRRYLAHSRAS